MLRILFIYCSFYLFTQPAFCQNENQISKLLDQGRKTNSEAVILYHNNGLVFEKYWGLGHPDSLIETMSCTKSIVALAFMAMMEDGYIDSLNFPVFKLFPEWNQGLKKQITIYHLLSMTSGIQNLSNASLEIYPSPDFVQLALAAELEDNPGDRFSYNNKALNLLAGICLKLTGLKLDNFIDERLFKPMGINQYKWSYDDSGNPHVMSGCKLKPMDFSKIGLMVLNKGQYLDRQILRPTSIELLLNPLSQYKGYGLLWWIDYKEVHYIVDDYVISNLKTKGASEEILSSVERIKGRYQSSKAFSNELKKAFGPQYWEYLNKAGISTSSIRRKEFIGNPVSYNANGYLGNYLVIVPQTRVVGLRMISHKSYNWDAENNNSFPDFIEVIQRLK